MVFARKIKVVSYLFFLVLFTACEKPKEEEVLIEDPTAQKAVYILNENSGFDTVLNQIQDLQGIGTAIGEIGLSDFTVENNTNLNYVYYTTLQSQQSNLFMYNRKTFNMNANIHEDLPSGANNLSEYEGGGFFRPYSNFFNFLVLNTNTTAGNIVYNGTFKGDVSAVIPSRNTIFGDADMGYLFPMVNSARFPGNPNYDYRQGCLTIGNLFGAPSYINKSCNPKDFAFQYSTNPAVPKVIANFFDVSISNQNITQFLYEEISYSFDLRSDSLLVHHIKDTLIDNYNTQKLQRITGTSVGAGLSNDLNIKKFRHYSDDGKVIGLYFQDLDSRKCWTFSFNYVNHTLTQGLQGELLDYSTNNSDIDIDEFGNVFYSGIAGNGNNINGVSIYKKDITGSVSLVGSDNFLKFGEVVKIKHLYGQVYVAVTGRISNTTYKQLTFLKQQ
jgi:hypothetical protein